MMRLLREPLLHFLVLGAALFGAFSLVNTPEAEAPATIVISAAQVTNLRDGFSRTWQRPPTEQELRGLVEDQIRDEVFYREGKALGLDRDDIIIRRRVRQKMEFLFEDMAATAPSEVELSTYLAAHPEQFRTDDRLSFRHVFLSASLRPDTLEGDAKRVAAQLATAGATVDQTMLGDPFLLGTEFHEVTRGDVTGTFGERFTEQLFASDLQRWQGPIPSPYGLHFTLVSERAEGSLPPLAAVRSAVLREWANARRIEAQEQFYRSLLQRYTVTVEAAPSDALAETASAVVAP